VAFTLFDLTYRTARELGIVKESVATGGSATTIVDTVMRTESDDYWTQGTAWILHDSAGADASPQGKSRVVSDFTASNDTITLQSTVTDAVASGDYYGVATKAVPNYVLVQKVNTALQEIGPIPVWDETTITIAADQTEYSLPIAASRDLRQVFLEYDKNDSNDQRWCEIFNWRVQPVATGTASLLVLPVQYATGYHLGLLYVDYHPMLYADTDKLAESVPIERVVWPAVLACLRYRKQTEQVTDYDEDIRDWAEKVATLNQLYPIRVPRRPSRVGIVNNTQAVLEDEPNKVYLTW
jgi:hypothetical protein